MDRFRYGVDVVLPFCAVGTSPDVRMVVAPLGLVNSGAILEQRLARYGQEFKGRAIARLLPPESTSIKEVANEIGVAHRH